MTLESDAIYLPQWTMDGARVARLPGWSASTVRRSGCYDVSAEEFLRLRSEFALVAGRL